MAWQGMAWQGMARAWCARGQGCNNKRRRQQKNKARRCGREFRRAGRFLSKSMPSFYQYGNPGGAGRNSRPFPTEGGVSFLGIPYFPRSVIRIFPPFP